MKQRQTGCARERREFIHLFTQRTEFTIFKDKAKVVDRSGKIGFLKQVTGLSKEKGMNK